MVRIGLDVERGAGGLVFPIAFLSLMDELETIHTHDVNAECAERIAVVIQNSILSSQSPFVVKVEDVLRTHFARDGAQAPGRPRTGFSSDVPCFCCVQSAQIGTLPLALLDWRR